MANRTYETVVTHSHPPDLSVLWNRRSVLVLGASAVVALLAVIAWQMNSASGPREAPEADRILAVQAGMPFQIMIPGYLPGAFDRASVGIKTDETGPTGEPMAALTYRTSRGATVFVREWVPVNPDMEILSGSRPIQTKWGKGWLLTQATSLVAVWVDIGPTRVAIFSHNLESISREQLVQVADSMGPASGRVVFSFVPDPPALRDVVPPPPIPAKMNDQGVQELTLVVTPGGYSPMRFSVKKGIPFKLTFRQLGPVGCGNQLTLPMDSVNSLSLELEDERDVQTSEFTPQEAGAFQFHCAHMMFRGIMTVIE